MSNDRNIERAARIIAQAIVHGTTTDPAYEAARLLDREGLLAAPADPFAKPGRNRPAPSPAAVAVARQCRLAKEAADKARAVAEGMPGEPDVSAAARRGAARRAPALAVRLVPVAARRRRERGPRYVGGHGDGRPLRVRRGPDATRRLRGARHVQRLALRGPSPDGGPLVIENFIVAVIVGLASLALLLASTAGGSE
ncbi:hypothetical protein R2F25_30165 [Streptomyces sp. UP1A-1]|nr:hypothetical protein [Streptomyces sp. UP1A-1]